MTNYNDLKTSIFDFFDSNRNKKYKIDELIKIFNLTKKEEILFREALLKLQQEEKIILKNCYYMIFPNDNNLKVGRLNCDSNNLFYIQNDYKKIYVLNNNLDGSIIKDDVLYEVKGPYNGKEYAVIKDIIKRNNDNIIADCVIENGKIKLVPVTKGFNYNIILKSSDLKNLVSGARVLINLISYNDNNYYGNIIDYIGHKDDPNLFVKTIAMDLSIRTNFSEDVINEVKKIPQEVKKEELKERVDHRDKIIFTIDGIDTKDIDDAISLEINERGNFVLGVHIADVSHYVKENSIIYNDAKSRGNSYYPANYVIPMLHHLLSNGICSLNEGVDRLTVSCIMEIDKSGNIISYNIEESVINSCKKMNYDDVNKVLNGEVVPGYEKYYDTLKLMEKLHYILDNKKKKRGYINFNSNEILTSIEQDEIKISEIKRDKAEKLIEDFMLLANNTVASYVYNMSLPFIYRCHDKPDKEKLKETITELQNMGYDIKVHKALDDNYCLQDILKQLEKYEEYPILSEKILQSIKRAIYTPNNIGHFCLALKNYTHFTSPIRRFTDLEIHTLLKKYIKGIYPENSDDLTDELKEIARHCNETTKLSDELERTINKKLVALYMQNHVNEVFNAVICSITKTNLTVKVDNCIYGKISISDLDEKYKFDPKTNYLYSKNKTLKSGDKIDVIFKGVENDKIKFESPTSSLVRIRK